MSDLSTHSKHTPRIIAWMILALLAAVVLGSLVGISKSYAADLGGTCCSDLEERIAELEATTATKGNRKVSLQVYGVVDEAIMHIDGDGLTSKWAVGRNSNVESFIGVAGSAVIMPHVSAGYVLEIGLGGGNTDSLLGAVGSPFAGSDNGTYTRRSFGYVKSDQLGSVSVGLDYQATHEISQISVANTQVAARILSLRPIFGPQIGEALDLFDGGRTDLVRYDSPDFKGFSLSGSWAPGGVSAFGFSQDTSDVWDIALRWHGEWKDIVAAAGIGYRQGIVIPTVGNLGSFSYPFCGGTCIDPSVISGSASIMHVPTGLFINGAAGKLDLGGAAGTFTGDITAWSVQAGDEQKLIPLGKTTVYGEYADSNVAAFDVGLSYWGMGVVQHIDPAAMDLYASYRKYDAAGSNVDFFMAGAKVNF